MIYPMIEEGVLDESRYIRILDYRDGKMVVTFVQRGHAEHVVAAARLDSDQWFVDAVGQCMKEGACPTPEELVRHAARLLAGGYVEGNPSVERVLRATRKKEAA